MGWNVLCCCKFSLTENEENELKLLFWAFGENYRIGPESWKCFRTVLGKLQNLTQNFQTLQISPCRELLHISSGFTDFLTILTPIWTQIEAQSLTQLPFDINWRIRLRKLKFWGLGAPQNPSFLHPFHHSSSIFSHFPSTFHLPSFFHAPIKFLLALGIDGKWLELWFYKGESQFLSFSLYFWLPRFRLAFIFWD